MGVSRGKHGRGDRDRLILLGIMRVLFPLDKMKFFPLTGLALNMGGYDIIVALAGRVACGNVINN